MIKFTQHTTTFADVPIFGRFWWEGREHIRVPDWRDEHGISFNAFQIDDCSRDYFIAKRKVFLSPRTTVAAKDVPAGSFLLYEGRLYHAPDVKRELVTNSRTLRDVETGGSWIIDADTPVELFHGTIEVTPDGEVER